jgi:hypothetical protein
MQRYLQRTALTRQAECSINRILVTLVCGLSNFANVNIYVFSKISNFPFPFTRSKIPPPTPTPAPAPLLSSFSACEKAEFPPASHF